MTERESNAPSVTFFFLSFIFVSCFNSVRVWVSSLTCIWLSVCRSFWLWFWFDYISWQRCRRLACLEAPTIFILKFIYLPQQLAVAFFLSLSLSSSLSLSPNILYFRPYYLLKCGISSSPLNYSALQARHAHLGNLICFSYCCDCFDKYFF